MATQTQGIFDSNLIEIDEALRLRNEARAANQPPPRFTCPQCNEPTRPHAGSTTNGAHFEHLKKNDDCALCHVGYVPVDQRATRNQLKPDFSVDDPKAIEGYLLDRNLLIKSRHQGLVRACKTRDNYQCQACDFRFEFEGSFVIECHHTKPMADYGRREVSLSELVSLCPTCHRVAHTRTPPFTATEIRQLMTKNSGIP
ncbi:HNH endonuclease [Pseudomonas fluorescens]|jgi:predicted HNH restriction endonuclease|uniref:HNH endonuclease n=1 Tax=Pseudomonas fluorescens TaxID=294 RepID=UPI001608C67A|nr:HNH endonuclease [Pseudomonas fluorescens]